MFLKVCGMNVIILEDNIGDNSKTLFSEMLYIQCLYGLRDNVMWENKQTNPTRTSMSELKSGLTESNSEHKQVLEIH